MTPATLTPPRRAAKVATMQDIGNAHGITPAVLDALRRALLREIAPPIFTEAVALELAKLVRKDWLDVSYRVAHEWDYSMATEDDPDPAVWIVVTVGLPTDGPRFQRGRGFSLAEAIGNVGPVNAGEVAR